MEMAVEAAPYVELDGHYTLVNDFDTRFPAGVPSMRDATSLRVRGDWTFGSDVKVVGEVALESASGHHRIAAGTVLDETDLD
jgi:UTP--glucose-1-phosphate uridylyltransferase